jgi:hypothetical protein
MARAELKSFLICDGPTCPSLTLNSCCSWGWPWTSDLLLSECKDYMCHHTQFMLHYRSNLGLRVHLNLAFYQPSWTPSPESWFTLQPSKYGEHLWFLPLGWLIMTTSRSHLALCFLWGAKAFIHSQVVDYADNQARIYHLGTIFPPFSQLKR